MKRPMDFFFRLGLLAAAIGFTSAQAAVDLRQRLEVSNDIREPVFGQIYFDYHMGHHYSALNRLLDGRKSGVFAIDDPTTEMLLGDLYTEYGLYREGDVAISRVQAQDIPSSTRNMPWMRYGKTLYQLGNDAPTENYLRKPPATLTSYQESERMLMLANVLIRKKSYQDAINMLRIMPAEGVTASYGLYNLGIALLQDKQTDAGLLSLNNLVVGAGTDEESLNLRDKAALAIAYYHLKEGRFEEARKSLLRVRLEGPYSNAALLTLAYTHFLNKEYAETLPATLELQRRNPADPNVQEAYLLSARSYEEMNFKAQALAGYRIAAKVLRDQLGQVERIAVKIDQPDWPDILSPARINTEDADVLSIRPLPASNDAITSGLFAKLFASPKFNEGFRQYQQLKRLDDLLAVRARDLDALDEDAGLIESRDQAVAADAEKIRDLRNRYGDLLKRWQDIQLRFKQMNANTENFTDSATQAENIRLQQLNKLSRRLQKLKASQEDTADLKDRLARLKAITLFEIARHAATRDEIFEKLQQATAQLRETKLRLSALDTLRDENQTLIKSAYSKKLPTLKDRLAADQTRIAGARAEYQSYLKNLANSLLDERRQKLTGYLSESYLGMERVESKVSAPAKENSDKS